MEIPKELTEKIYKLISSAKADGKIRRGANETTKSAERGEAKLVVSAADVTPPEVIAHLPLISKEKSIPFAQVPAKSELGAAAGLPVGTAAVAVVGAGEERKLLDDITKSLKTLAGPSKSEPPAGSDTSSDQKKPAEAKAEKKPEPKPEEKPAEKKEEPKAKAPEEGKKEEAPAEEAKPEAEPEEKTEEIKEKGEPEKEPEETKKEVEEKGEAPTKE